MEKLYVIDGKLMELEALATNMASGKDFYFLRNVNNASDINHIPVEELPEPYIKNEVTIPQGVLYFSNWCERLSHEETNVDTGFNATVYKTKSGDFVRTKKYYNVNGALVYVGQYGRVITIPNSPNRYEAGTKNLWSELSRPLSLVTGRVVEDGVMCDYANEKVLLNRDEVVFSSLSDDVVVKESDHYIETDDDKIITRRDIKTGLTDEYFVCDDCDEIHSVEERNYLENYDKDVCEGCLDNYRWSDYDDMYLDESDGEYVESVDSFVSYDSIEENFTRCQECGELFVTDDMFHAENDYWLCDYCAQEYTDDEGYYVNGNCNFIHCYSYKPDAQFFGGDSEKYLGLEYEVEGGGYNDHKAKKIFGGQAHWYCKSDGSLDNGFEAVTHPCTPEFMLKSIDWDKITEQLEDNGYDETYGAGIHIHVSRNHFKSRSHIGKLIRFFAENYDDLVLFANRPSSQAEQWAQATDVCGCSTFESCYNEARCERYSAVNVQNAATIEIRLWNTTYNPSTLRSFIQMTDVLTDLANGQWEDFTWTNVRKLGEERGYDELLHRLGEQGK